MTVSGETFSASALSSTLSPPKKRVSTAWLDDEMAIPTMRRSRFISTRIRQDLVALDDALEALAAMDPRNHLMNLTGDRPSQLPKTGPPEDIGPVS